MCFTAEHHVIHKGNLRKKSSTWEETWKLKFETQSQTAVRGGCFTSVDKDGKNLRQVKRVSPAREKVALSWTCMQILALPHWLSLENDPLL